MAELTMEEARYRYGFVLRDVEPGDVSIGSSATMCINLKTFGDILTSAVVFMPVKNIIKIRNDVTDLSNFVYDVVLMDDSYSIFYTTVDDSRQRIKKVSRDLLIAWYYKVNISKSPTYYDLPYVPFKLLGFVDEHAVSRDVTWQSSIIKPGTNIFMSVLNENVRYIPEYESIMNMKKETGTIESYVNIVLEEGNHRVTYKDESTGWKLHKEYVDKHMIIADYLDSMMRLYYKMSWQDYMQYKRNLQKELQTMFV